MEKKISRAGFGDAGYFMDESFGKFGSFERIGRDAGLWPARSFSGISAGEFMMFKEMMGNFDKWLEENKEKLEQLTIDKEQLTSRTANNSVKGQMSVVSGQKVGRNDPCPCGAKKEDGRPIKYKHCLGRNV